MRVFVDRREGNDAPVFPRRAYGKFDGRRKGKSDMKEMLPKDSEIAALLPEYTSEGDMTRIVLTNGTALVLRRTMRAART